MKCIELVKEVSTKQSGVEQQPQPAKTTEQMLEESEKLVEDLTKLVKDLMANNAQQTESIPESSLDDSEINEVRSYILYIKQKYFPDIKFSKTMPSLFMWNIPREVYDTAAHMVIRDEPDVLNPLFWLFMYCVDLTPGLACKILKEAFGAVTKDDYERLDVIIKEEEEEDELQDN